MSILAIIETDYRETVSLPIVVLITKLDHDFLKFS